MKLTILKQEIEKIAKETGKTEIDVISAMQSHMASLKDEKSIEILCKLKRQYIAKR